MQMETLQITPKEALQKFFGFNKGHQEAIINNLLEATIHL
jgi:hypothetical protein